jgi:hypothetical protein
MKRALRFLPLTALACTSFLAGPAGAVGTRRFVLQNAEDYKGGDLKGVAVDSSGRVRAGLTLGAVPVPQATTIWSALDRRDGSILLGTGNDGKLLEVRNAKINVLAETKALVVTSLAEAWGGAVVLGTLPDGKVMKYERGKLSDLATLKGAEHVWQVAYDAKTRSVFAATGPEGKLWRIGAGGEAQVYFDSEEQHLMSVAVGPDGTVYAGASDKAKLYKITGPGRASVLYDFARTEVRAIAVSAKNEVYAIANEIKSGSYAPSRRGRSGNSPQTAQPAPPPPKTQGKGTLFYFSPDGTPEQLLDDSEEHCVSLALADDGQPYVGTGANGRIYTIDVHHNSVLVADTEERQIGALVMNGKQQMLAASDPAVVHPVRGVGGADAIWTSKVLDAGIRARFGRLNWDATGVVELSTRTGNTKDADDTWSAWSNALTAPGTVQSPPARYVQVRARFSRDRNAALSEITLPFVTDNLRAIVTEIDASSGAKKSRKDSSDSSPDGVVESGGPIDKKPDATVTLTWKVDNPDKDSLRYRLQYRLVGTASWYDILKPHEKLTKETHSWETSDMPEGMYRVRVIASDELSNPPDRVKRDDMESGTVLVDNTEPTVNGLKLAGRHLQATLIDGVGPIQRIEAALVGTDEWYPLYPVDGVFDEQREELDADISAITGTSTGILSLRVYDKAGNFVVRSVAVK